MSADCPNRCTGTIALVRGVIAAIAAAGLMLKVSGSMSTSTGCAPSRATQPAVAKNEYVLVTTSSPGPISSAISAASTASVPDDMPRACGVCRYASSSRSMPSTSGPMMKRWLSQTRVIASSMAWRNGVYCALRSSKGTVTKETSYYNGVVNVDVAIIGGGVTGLAAALSLADRGATVCILEREPKPGRATSTHNSGVIHAGLYYPTGSLKARLCVEGRDRLYAFCAAHNIPHQRCGKLIVATDLVEIDELHKLKIKAHDNGVTSLVEVDAAFVRAREPHVHSVAALWSPDTGIVEAEALVRALAHLCKERDVALVVGTPLLGAERGSDGMTLVTPHERFVARTVVNAAGLYADVVSHELGASRFTIYPCRGEYAEL